MKAKYFLANLLALVLLLVPSKIASKTSTYVDKGEVNNNPVALKVMGSEEGFDFVGGGGHSHDYSYDYERIDYQYHYEVCSCGAKKKMGHFVTGSPNSQGLYTCLRCGGSAKTGFVVHD